MSEKAAIARHKLRVLRGRILRTLRNFYSHKPNTLGFESVRHAVDRREWTIPEIREQLTYLMQMGYVDSPDNRRDALDEDPMQVWALSAKGLQLLNGDLADNSIEIEIPHE